ncbi:MAG: UDP-N-acetylmuramoyl-L-alanine--D-glutamate ligase [Acidobacteria bacterium]|nr:UDP-N-acetylmuramoyl-L-alanine--D-glutamate ligase [Acidobacteriota bacterium]
MSRSTDRQIYVVLGLARSGQAAAQVLLGEGHIVRVTDIRPATDFDAVLAALLRTAGNAGGSLETVFGRHPVSLLDGAAAVILSPGVPERIPFVQAARRRAIPVWSEVELAARHLHGTMIGITGSNGKSTTTALLAHILQQAGRPAHAAGNIGRALCEFIPGDTPTTTYVTELSSFQLETIDTFRPHIGLILNITPDHLDRYHSVDEYARAKWALFKNCSASDFAVLNARDPWLVSQAPILTCRVLWFDSTRRPSPADIPGAGLVDDRLWLRLDDESLSLMARAELPLPGRHNLENCLAAALAARLCGLNTVEIRQGIVSFRGLAHRLETVAEIDGRLFVNDSKATNIDSTRLALESYGQPVVLILGGKDKGSDFSSLRETIQAHVRHMLLVGEAAPLIERALAGTAPLTHCRDFDEVVRRGLELSAAGDVVLLSPACASFDMFDDFEHRGEVFRQAVLALQKEKHRC